jgi:hypothetical protein
MNIEKVGIATNKNTLNAYFLRWVLLEKFLSTIVLMFIFN